MYVDRCILYKYSDIDTVYILYTCIFWGQTRPKVYRCDIRSAAITAMGFEDSDSKDCDPIDSDS